MKNTSIFAWTVPRLAICLAGFASGLPAIAEDLCASPAIISPGQESTSSSVRPGISWEAVAGASGYRLRLVSREPEGRSLATIDTIVVGTVFMPPQALSDGLSVVRVSVTSQCTAAGRPMESPGREHRFLIDARPACPVKGLVAEVAERRIRWLPTPGATRYEVFGYDAMQGRLLFTRETSAPTVVTPAPANNPVVVAVRARCGEVFGQLGYLAY